MNLTNTNNEPGTSEWAEDIKEYLGMNLSEEGQQDEEEEREPAPFRVRIPNTEVGSLRLVSNEQHKEIKRPLRKRLLGIRRKTVTEVKTFVLEQMAGEEPTIQRDISRNITRAIFVQNNSVSVLRPRDLKYKYYEMNDLQFNVFCARVKEETEKDKLKVIEQKEAMLEEMNRIQEARDRSYIMI